uniref:BZIP domain-containing protein n=1 Tax=Helicotheca tamesis TaxID=374047 RepID=A0A7S2MH60_9STRA|mmetsp:Transcript_1589/g.2276  ORF Transcript_1589/g.2276 Transcript_1589/m.2276 type:complete len:103 (+) Transcript_1589:63-371(+)
MEIRSLLLVAILAVLAISTQAFAPATFGVRTSTALNGCRVNAKKEKRQRNRENMRKFKSKRGTSRRKTMKKLQSNQARAAEAEFLAKCFITMPPPGETADKK